MTEIETYQLKDVKLSLNVKVGKEAPKWFVKANKDIVYGAVVAKSYTSCVTVFKALERALDVIAKDSWGFKSCDQCGELRPNVSKTQIWYNEDEERLSYLEKVCSECKEKFLKAGALKE